MKEKQEENLEAALDSQAVVPGNHPGAGGRRAGRVGPGPAAQTQPLNDAATLVRHAQFGHLGQPGRRCRPCGRPRRRPPPHGWLRPQPPPGPSPPPLCSHPAHSPPAQLTTTAAPARPVRVKVPAVGINAPVVPEPLGSDGTLLIPAPGQVGWYEAGPSPAMRQASGPSTLVFVLCGGGFLRARHVYADNMVIGASPAGGITAPAP
jgi:hypothetical protein